MKVSIQVFSDGVDIVDAFDGSLIDGDFENIGEARGHCAMQGWEIVEDKQWP